MNQSAIENISAGILQKVTSAQAWHYHVVPYEVESDMMLLYADVEKARNGLEEELELLFGKAVHLRWVESDVMRHALSKHYRRETQTTAQRAPQDIRTNTLSTKDDFLDELISNAKYLGSSDIHLEPYEHKCRIRFRIDGVLVERYQLAKEDYPAIVNKIKIRGNLDIAEKRLPQDGRIFVQKGNLKFDIRVSTLPTLHGEKIVMRLLSSGGDTGVEIEKLGFEENQFRDFMEAVRKPNGIVLISGPTGSGKTTTLYGTLQVLNQTERNILTIEDPIEYTLEGINQVQLKPAIGLDFASALKTFLRQDPDVIMVGEIRDLDTASMAIRASLTGHLVMSTIHTNSAWGIVSRLSDMGVPGYLLADTLNAAVAQRLVRVLCPNCRSERVFDSQILPRNYQPTQRPSAYYEPVGCEQCHYTGYQGRRAIYEVISIDNELADLIKAENLNIKERLQQKGIRILADNAFDLFIEGKTSIHEIYSILASHR